MKPMAWTFLILSIFVSIVSGFVHMRTRHTRIHGFSGAGANFALAATLAFMMSAGPAWLFELLR